MVDSPINQRLPHRRLSTSISDSPERQESRYGIVVTNTLERDEFHRNFTCFQSAFLTTAAGKIAVSHALFGDTFAQQQKKESSHAPVNNALTCDTELAISTHATRAGCCEHFATAASCVHRVKAVTHTHTHRARIHTDGRALARPRSVVGGSRTET